MAILTLSGVRGNDLFSISFILFFGDPDKTAVRQAADIGFDLIRHLVFWHIFVRFTDRICDGGHIMSAVTQFPDKETGVIEYFNLVGIRVKE